METVIVTLPSHRQVKVSYAHLSKGASALLNFVWITEPPDIAPTLSEDEKAFIVKACKAQN